MSGFGDSWKGSGATAPSLMNFQSGHGHDGIGWRDDLPAGRVHQLHVNRDRLSRQDRQQYRRAVAELNVLVYNGAGSQTTVSDLVVNWLVIGY